MNLPQFALKNRFLIISTMLLALCWGLWTFQTVPRNEDPVYQIRTCVVGTSWPAASANKVEQLITVPLEKAIGSLVEVRRIRSESRVGLSLIFVDLEQRKIKSVPDVWQKMRNKVQEAAAALPAGASPPYVDTEFGEVEAMMLSLYTVSQQYSYKELRKLARTVQSQLSPLPMMGRVQILGVQDEVIHLEVPAGIWSRLHVSSEEIAYALQERNIVEPGGSLDTNLSQFIVRLTGEFETTKQIETVTLGSLDNNAPTYLRDFGIHVRRTYKDPPTMFCRYNSKELGHSAHQCLIISFSMKRGGNLVTLGNLVRDKLAEINERMLPPDVRLAVIADQPNQVQTSINGMLTNLYQGMLIVILVGFMLTTVRLSCVMATAIPMVLIPTIGIMTLFGIEMEQVSIASLIVALGMVVDNAIETAENVQRLLMEGMERTEAAWRGTQQVAISMLTATLTTMAAFLPLLIIPGEVGEFIYSLPIVVSVALLFSWVYSLTVNTLFCYWFVRPEVVAGGFLATVVRFWIAMVAVISRIRQGQGEIIAFTRKLWGWVTGKKTVTEGEEEGFIRTRYGKILPVCLEHRYLTLSICALLLSTGIFLSGMIGDQFFPLAFRDQFLIDVWLPAGTTIERTDEVCKEIEKIVRNTSVTSVTGEGSVDRLRDITTFVGGSVPRFYITVDPQPDQANFAQLLVNTNAPRYTDQYILDLREKIDAQVVGARVTVKKLNLGTLTGAPLALRIVGTDPQQMRPLAVKLKRFLAQQPEVIDIYDDWGSPAFQVELEIDPNLANAAGVTNRDVFKTISAYLAGQYLTSFQEDDVQLPVYLRLPRHDRNALGDLQNFYVEGKKGRVPIDGIAKTVVGYSESNRIRRNQQCALTVYAYVSEEAYPNDVIRKILPQIETMQQQVATDMPGYALEIGGEWEETRATDVDVIYAFNISVLLIALVLIWQYDGILRPILVLLSVFMGMTGGLFGLFITGWPLNFMATLGLISISGIVVNDAIVLVDFTDDFRKNSGLPLKEAVIKAARFRVVPIFLTSFTTIGGLMTLSGPLWEPMRDVMIFGLFSSTFLTLFVVPCSYYVFAHDLKWLKER
jgi:multidrug efflux pump subunit AcrB